MICTTLLWDRPAGASRRISPTECRTSLSRPPRELRSDETKREFSHWHFVKQIVCVEKKKRGTRGSNLELDEELVGDAVGRVGGIVERGGERLELGAEEKVGRGGQ